MGKWVTYPASDGTEVRSYLVRPISSTRHPVAVILRGVAGPDKGYIEIAERFAEHGVAALLHGWQVRGNDPTDMQVGSDIGSALQYLKGLPSIDSSRITLCGYCRGGGHAIVAAAMHREVAAIVTFHGFAVRTNKDDYHANPIDFANQLRCPVLILHGEEDDRSAASDMRLLLSRLQSCEVPVVARFYEGVGHGFAVSTHPGFDEVSANDSFKECLTFLRKYASLTE